MWATVLLIKKNVVNNPDLRKMVIKDIHLCNIAADRLQQQKTTSHSIAQPMNMRRLRVSTLAYRTLNPCCDCSCSITREWGRYPPPPAYIPKVAVMKRGARPARFAPLTSSHGILRIPTCNLLTTEQPLFVRNLSVQTRTHPGTVVCVHDRYCLIVQP